MKDFEGSNVDTIVGTMHINAIWDLSPTVAFNKCYYVAIKHLHNLLNNEKYFIYTHKNR